MPLWTKTTLENKQMESNNPVEASVDTTLPGLDTAVATVTDSKIDDLFTELYPETAAKVPVEVDEPVEVEDTEIEASGDEGDLAPLDSDSDTEESETEEVEVDEDTESTPLEAVTIQDMIDGGQGIEIDGKVYSGNDIKSAFGRQTKQEVARNEVELAQKALAEERQNIAQYQQVIREKAEIQQHEGNLNQYKAAIQRLQQQREDARLKNDTDTWNRIGMDLEPMLQQHTQAEHELNELVENNRNDNMGVQRQALQDKGFGELLSDQQRRNSLSEYISTDYSPSAFNAITNDAELLILAEKARLYDKAKSNVPKAKLKTSGKKSLRSGASKSKPAKTPVNRIDSKIDEMFSKL